MDFSSFAFEFQWEQCFSLLEKWKVSMIDEILSIYQGKQAQIQSYKDQAEASLEKTKFIFNINDYFQHECVLSAEIDCFKSKLTQFKQDLLHRPLPLDIQMTFPSLENSISIAPLFTKELFEEKKLLQEYQLPRQQQPVRLMATSSNQILLVHHQSKISLYDQFLGFIDELDVADHTEEYLHAISYCQFNQTFLLLCDYSLWALENLELVKLAEIPTKKHLLNHFISFHQTLFFIYNSGEYIDRWTFDTQWKLEKRWSNLLENQVIQSVSSNDLHLLFSTNHSIHLCSENLTLQYTIAITPEHLYSDFVYISSHRIWLCIDRQSETMKYFHMNERLIHSLDQINVQKISAMENNVALVTTDSQLQIISHCSV